jgi:serine/threonine protein kinase
MPEQNEVENVVAVLPAIEELQQDAGTIILEEDHTESLIADAMEDTEVSFEEVLKETMETVKEQQDELSRLHAIVSSQALQLRNLCGQEVDLPELLESLEGLRIQDEDAAVDGFTVLLLEELRLDEVEMPLVAEDVAVDHDDVSSVRSSLSSLSESLDELESAVSLVEQQHLELVNLRHLLLIQNAVLHGLLAPVDQLDEGLPKTRMKTVDAAAENEPFNQMDELDDENAMSVDLELDVDVLYEFAVKVCPLMMSCSADHARRMLRKELMPAMRGLVKFGDKSVLDMWHFPAHFNIVELYGGYVVPLCDVTALENLSPPGVQRWPVVESLNQGCAVCVVMKRYEFTLAEFLASHSPGILESSLLLLQLLEAVVHLGVNGICHRNLNTSNILVEMTSTGYHLVISDFSQSICGDGLFGLHVPYVTDETYKGGCLLAPEIDNAERFSFLNYRKADLWAVGAIAYEIFGSKNPFSRSGGLMAANYSERDLPDLPSNVPEFISHLVKSMLRRNPNERPEPVNVADALHVLLWAPKEWITRWERGDQTVPKEVEIRRWIVQLAAILRCGMFGKKDTSVVETLQKMFISRCDPQSIHDTVRLLWR